MLGDSERCEISGHARLEFTVVLWVLYATICEFQTVLLYKRDTARDFWRSSWWNEFVEGSVSLEWLFWSISAELRSFETWRGYINSCVLSLARYMEKTAHISFVRREVVLTWVLVRRSDHKECNFLFRSKYLRFSIILARAERVFCSWSTTRVRITARLDLTVKHYTPPAWVSPRWTLADPWIVGSRASRQTFLLNVQILISGKVWHLWYWHCAWQLKVQDVLQHSVGGLLLTQTMCYLFL